MKKDIYIESVLREIPRLLGQIDCNPASSTYGCCDRQYWHNNTVSFPGARFQEAVLTLALLYNDFETPYRGNRNILEIINACISFWCDIQEKDGSFNEWYIHEGSYVATAFSSYAVSEALITLGRDKIDLYDRTIACLMKSADWLKTRTERTVCNQQTGALICLYNVYVLTGKEDLMKSVISYEENIAGSQNEEGWLREYGGADVGYLSLSIDYLSKYYKKTGSKKIERVINKAIDFISDLVSKDGTAGGVYGSRGTEYLIPDGFEIFAKRNEKAAYVAYNIRKSISAGKGVSVFSLDDRYLMYISYTFLQAFIDGDRVIAEKQISVSTDKYYKESDFYIHREGAIELIANMKMTGAFTCTIGTRRVSDSGVVIYADRKLFSGYIDPLANVKKAARDGFIVEGRFHLVKENIMTPVRSMLIFIFQSTLGRIPFINSRVKTLLRNRMILVNRPSGVRLRREVKIMPDSVKVIDEIIGAASFEKIVAGAKTSFIYVPSAQFYQIDNLRDEGCKVVDASDIQKDKNYIRVEREFVIDK